MLAAVPPEKRGISSGLIGMGMALGILGGMAMSGPVYEFFGSYRAPFLLLTIPTALMIALFLKKLPDVRNPDSPSWKTYKRLFRDRDLWKINIATFTSLYGFWVAATWGPTFLQAERSFSLSKSGLYTGLIALTALPGGVLWGRLSDRLGRKKIALSVLPVSAAALFLFTRAETPAQIIAGDGVDVLAHSDAVGLSHVHEVDEPVRVMRQPCQSGWSEHRHRNDACSDPDRAIHKPND